MARKRDKTAKPAPKPKVTAKGGRGVPPLPAPLTPPRDNGPTLLPDDGTLLEQSRLYWLVGEWDRLAQLAETDLDSHPDRAKLALLAAGALAQLGQSDAARRLAHQARDWGCDPALMARVLLGGAYNSLGRVAQLLGDASEAARFFETSEALITPQGDNPILAEARALREAARTAQRQAEMRDHPPELQPELPPGLQPELPSEFLAPSLPGAADPAADPAVAPPRKLPQILAWHQAQPETRPDRPILACCHHKSGTNFLLPVMRGLSAAFDMDLWLKFYDPEPESWQICMHQHARIADLPADLSFRGVHLVRHPMGLILSAALYHERCDEAWAHIPLERFSRATFQALSDREIHNELKDPDVPTMRKQALMSPDPGPGDFESPYAFEGRTYAEMLRSFDSRADRIRFEMNTYSRAVVEDMLNFPKDRRFYAVQLEAVSHDTQMIAVQEMMHHLGFAGPAAATALEIAAKQCFWNRPRPLHATTGVSRAWEEDFTGALLSDFRMLFGWADEALGYT